MNIFSFYLYVYLNEFYDNKASLKRHIKVAFLKDTPTDRAVFEKNILLLFWLE